MKMQYCNILSEEGFAGSSYLRGDYLLYSYYPMPQVSKSLSVNNRKHW